MCSIRPQDTEDSRRITSKSSEFRLKMWQKISVPLTLVLCILVLPTLSLTEKRVYKDRRYSPRSCLQFLKRGYRSDGYYLIYISGNTPFTVYCDMNSEAGSAWTLVMSYALENIKMSEFKKNPLQANAPVNELSPNWNTYRMALKGMKHLASFSTHWRATCDFPNHGVDYIDYVRGKFSVFNIMKYLGYGVCKKVEYVDIRGNRCAHCTARWWQLLGKRSPHMVSSHRPCQFNGRRGTVGGEDNFNYYDHYNKKFRCSSSPKATTNWWFGGYLNY